MPSYTLSNPWRFQTTVFTALHYSSLLRVLHTLLSQLEIIYLRSGPQPLKHAHSPLVLLQYKHFKQKNVRTLQQRSQTSTHLNLCISHSASTLGPMKLAMDLTPCNKDTLPLQPQYILPACYSLWCDIALHGIYHWIHKALVIFPQSNEHASTRLHTCPQQAQILTIPHNNRHLHYTHGPVYWNVRNRSIHYAVYILRYKCCRWEMSKVLWEMLTGKEMVMRILRD